MTWYLENVNFLIVFFLIFSNLCCRYTLKLPLWGNSNVYLQHMSFQYMSFSPSAFLNKFSTSFINLKKWACRNKQLSCSLSCTCMTIIDCQFLCFWQLILRFSWACIAKLLVAWLYIQNTFNLKYPHTDSQNYFFMLLQWRRRPFIGIFNSCNECLISCLILRNYLNYISA